MRYFHSKRLKFLCTFAETLILIRMEFFRKSGTLYNLIILIVFLSFARTPVNDSTGNENHKKGGIAEFVQLLSSAVEYINPNVERAHSPVFPVLKLFSEKPYSCDINESGNNLSAQVRFSRLISLTPPTPLEKICKLQI
jgi:hypothetical protein